MKTQVPTVLANAITAGFVLAIGGDRVAAQVDVGGTMRDCIDVHEIERTTVVDDSTVLFRMNDGRFYRNDLPRQCPQLRSEDRFSYRVATSELCSVDVITVVEDAGFELREGATCALGKFASVSEAGAEELAEKRRPGAGR